MQQSTQSERPITDNFIEETAHAAPLPAPLSIETRTAITQAEQVRHFEVQSEAVLVTPPIEVYSDAKETHIIHTVPEQTIHAVQLNTELRSPISTEGTTITTEQSLDSLQSTFEETTLSEIDQPIAIHEAHEVNTAIDLAIDASVAEIGTPHSESAPTIEPERVEQMMRELLFESPVDQQNYFVAALEAVLKPANLPEDHTEPQNEAPVTMLLKALQHEQVANIHKSEESPTAVTIQKIIGTIHGHVAIREYAALPEIEAVEEQLQELVLELCSHLSVEMTDEQVDSLVELLLSDKFALAISAAYASNRADITIPTLETTEQGTHEAKIKFGNLARHTTHSIQSGMHQLLGSLAVISFQRV